MLLVVLVAGGVDKFTRAMIDWSDYVAPVLTGSLRPPLAMTLGLFGAAEVLLGILVAVAPRAGGYAAMGYLWLWSLNVLGCGDHSDAAFWTLGLSIAGLAVSLLARQPVDAERGRVTVIS